MGDLFADADDIPPNVLARARCTLDSLDGSPHIRKRKENLVALRAVLVYEAYRSLGVVMDPEEVWKRCGGDDRDHKRRGGNDRGHKRRGGNDRTRKAQKEMGGAYKYLGVEFGYEPVDFSETPEMFLAYYIRLSDMHENMLPTFASMCKRAVARNTSLRELPPQMLAKALLLSYAQKRSITLGEKFDRAIGNPEQYKKLVSQL